MAERNPRIPHSIESLLFVNRNGKYCGYKLELISDNISADRREFLICAECKGISRKPRQRKGITVCEVCVPGHSMGEINKRVGNTVASLNARCPLSGEGCDWEGKLGGIEQHMEECLKVRVERQLECGISIERGTYEQDNREACPLQKKRCDYCNQKVHAKDENRHIRKCENHPDTEVPCPYKELGCEVIVLRKNRGIHITENITNHNKLMSEQIEQLNQLKNRNVQLERVNEQQKNGNVQLERTNQQQKNRNVQLERTNQQQKNKNVQQEKGNQLLERANEQQKNRNEELQRVNEQQKNRNEEQQRVNQQRITTNVILATNHQQRQSNTEREGEYTKERNMVKRRWTVWALLALVVVGVRILITTIIGIAVAVTQGNNLKSNANQPKTNANQPKTDSNQPETNLTLNESLLSNASYIYKYIGARRKFLPGIEKIYDLKKTGTFYGPTFYLGQCKLRLKTYARVPTHLNYERYTKYYVERLEGEYDGLIDNCIITCAYTTFSYKNTAQTEDTDSTYPSIDLKVGESKLISYKYWKQSGGEVIVKFYFDIAGV